MLTAHAQRVQNPSGALDRVGDTVALPPRAGQPRGLRVCVSRGEAAQRPSEPRRPLAQEARRDRILAVGSGDGVEHGVERPTRVQQRPVDGVAVAADTGLDDRRLLVQTGRRADQPVDAEVVQRRRAPPAAPARRFAPAAKELVAPRGVKNSTPGDRGTSFAASRLRHSHNQTSNNKNPERLSLLKQSGVATTA
jgi:hypothetical protein